MMILLLLIFFPMVMALVCYGIGRKNRQLRNYFAMGVGIAEFVLAILAALSPAGTVSVGQVCALGLRLELDGFRKVYGLVIALMWMMTLLLSDEYFRHYHNRNRYFFFNLLTLGATMGVFLAGDLFTAFIFFEVMSFTSYTWVLHEETPAAIRAANTYLAVAVIGGLVALMGLFLLQSRLGTTRISQLHTLAQVQSDKTALYVAGGCILFGFGAKAGMFPLHIWLPKAHPVAPAPASALLSGVLTKSGVWGILAISCNIFRYDPAWGTVILTLGTVTMVLGAVLALFSVDLKRTLACSSMSQIGFVLVGVGMMGILGQENALAARGALLHMMNHSLFKLVLFLCAGVVFMNLHELNLNKIRGFGRKKPVLNLCFLLGAMGIGGIPLLSGYVSKTLLHEAIVEGKALTGAGALTMVEWLFLISGGLTLAYMTKLYICLFVEKNPEKQAEYDENRHYMNPVSTLAVLVPALLLPLLGITAGKTMDGIADLGTDFFHCGPLEHAVHYLSLENLRGAGISLLIGAAIYLLVVRKLLMKDGEYVNRWPEKLDLEELLYRPLILKWLPGIFGWIGALFGENRLTVPVARGVFRVYGIVSRAVCDLPDGLIYLLRKTVYRESPVTDPEDDVKEVLAYRFGEKLDQRAVRHGRETPEEHRYARRLFRVRKTVRETSAQLIGTLSFALLMLAIAVFVIFVYMM